ncbi:MAG: hypothetical protein ABIV28_08900 [Longimicrobiales bacterium]
MNPYDAIFGRPEFEDEIFPAITADAVEHGVRTHVVDEFLQLPATTALLEKLSPAEVERASPFPGVAALGFHGYHHWLGGKRSHEIDEGALREMLAADSPAIGTWSLHVPEEAGYVVMPANLLWATQEGATPEAVHGFFYATSSAEGIATRLDLLLALGVRQDRAGFTAIEISVPLPVPDLGHFGDIEAREQGPDFANVLPGGELRGLLAVTNAGEVLKLASRVFHQLGVDSGSGR